MATHPSSLERRLVVARGARGLVDGLVSVVLAADLSRRGLSSFEIGALVTASLLGSALLTLGGGARGRHAADAGDGPRIRAARGLRGALRRRLRGHPESIGRRRQRVPAGRA